MAPERPGGYALSYDRDATAACPGPSALLHLRPRLHAWLAAFVEVSTRRNMKHSAVDLGRERGADFPRQ